MLRRENKNIGTISTHHSCLKKAHECDGELVVHKHPPTFCSEGLPSHSAKVHFYHRIE